MDFTELKQAAAEMKLTAEAKQRILFRCKTEDKKVKIFGRRTLILAAVLALCLCVTAGAASGQFRDVTNMFGAITGQEYVNAENDVSITAENGAITVELVNKDEVAFSYIEELKLADFKVFDAQGKEIEFESVAVPVIDRAAKIALPQGAAKIKINVIEGLEKAEQPLVIKGSWTVEIK